jgi:ABC-2 type transport system ATP-binding protein
VRLELDRPIEAGRLQRYGEIEQHEGAAVRLLIGRDRLTASLNQLLADLPVVDLEVRDPPIEELIGRLFQQGSLDAMP